MKLINTTTGKTIEEGMSDDDAFQAAEDMDDEGVLDFDVLFELIEEEQP